MSRRIIKKKFSYVDEDINDLHLNWGIGKCADAQIL